MMASVVEMAILSVVDIVVVALSVLFLFEARASIWVN